MTDHTHRHHELEPEDYARLYTQEFWDERYASAPALWSGRANQRLVEQVADLPPGTALDAARAGTPCGSPPTAGR